MAPPVLYRGQLYPTVAVSCPSHPRTTPPVLLALPSHPLIPVQCPASLRLPTLVPCADRLRATPSVQDIVQSIPAGSRFFAKMDAIHGYFQLSVEEESSKITTFLLPSGRYRYLRAPMGLSSSSDEWCRQSDRAIEGLPFTRKIVDDILIWADSMPSLIERIRIVAKRCQEMNIILSKKKFQIGSELPFAGLIVSANGISPDPDRTKALSEFPVPKDVTGVRSFLGLANQLSGFVPDFAHMTVALRGLTGKNASFIWLEEHQREFDMVRKLLTSSMVVTHFDPKLPVTVLTDASRLYGLGYAMGHFIKDQFKLVTCGSKSLTPTQQRYSTIELECLAVHFAVSKCSFYLKGAESFTVATDHRPLEGIFKKDLFEIPNPRLQRIREKLVEYNMTVKWVPGKSHFIADALSRAPLFSPPVPDEEEFTIDTARSCLTQVVEKNNELKLILDSLDSDYVQFRKDVMTGSFSSVYSNQMKSVFDQLSVDDELVYLDGNRIVLPNGAIKQVLALLHTSHAGINRTYEMARSLYFWPGMLNDVKQLVEGCMTCRKHRPSLPVNKRTTPAPSSYMGPPMGHVGVDLFDFGGNKFLVCVDQWSGYPLYQKLTSTTTSSVLKTLSSWFNVLGWPRSIRSDGGPQFRGEFSSFCEKNKIKHELSSPYNPRSNGLARENGLSVWIDESEMSGGDKLYKKLEEGLTNSTIFIVCHSKEYNESSNCQKELTYAVNTLEKENIIPILLDDSKVNLAIADIVYIPFHNGKGAILKGDELEEKFDKLLKSVRKMLPDKGSKI